MLGYDNNTAGFRPGAGTLTVMASIYGSVMLRPARVGLLTAAPTLDDLRHAVHAATSAWGGMYFPIVDIQGGGGNKLWFEQLSIDVLCSLVEHDSANELAQQTGFRWAGRPPYGPFDPPQDGLSTRLLESDHLASPQGAGLALADWSAEDPLSTLFTVWFGDFGADEYGQRCRARFAARGRTIVANSEGVLDPDLLHLASPVAATTFQIEYRGDGPGPGLVVVDPASPADLLRFWNIRAAGGNVVPWPVGGEGVVEPAISAWLEVLLETNQVSRFSGADDTAGSAGLYVWPNRTGGTAPPALKKLLDSHGIEVLPGHYGRGGWRGTHPLSTEFRRTFTIDVDTRVAAAQLPLSALPWASGRPPSAWPGIVAAEVRVSSENGLDPDRTMAVPRVRRLASLLDRYGASDDSFHRPNGQGGIYSVSAAADHVIVALAHPVAIFEGLFDRTGWVFEQSDDGRFASRLDHRLGGANYQLANQPAAREIMLRAATRSDLGANFEMLRAKAETARGSWPNGVLNRLTPKDYTRSLILQLTDRKLLRSVLPLTCPSCGNTFALEPDKLSDELVCGFCDHRFPLASVLARMGPKNTQWRYRIAGHVSEGRLEAALPVIATTSVLTRLGRGGFDNKLEAKGLKFSISRTERAEFDVAMVVDTFQPIVVLGEVKSHGIINAGDIENLGFAQRALRETGVECFILIATLKEAFSTEETELLRDYCQKAGELLLSDHSATPLALPLIFTRDQLSVSWHSDDHPWRWGEGWRGLASIAKNSCMKNLGLNEITTEWSEDGPAYEFFWKTG